MQRIERKNIFLDSDLYRMAKAYATMKDKTVGEIISEALRVYLDSRGFASHVAQGEKRDRKS